MARNPTFLVRRPWTGVVGLLVAVLLLAALTAVFVPRIARSLRIKGIPAPSWRPVTTLQAAERLARQSVGYDFSDVRAAFHNNEGWTRLDGQEAAKRGGRLDEEVWSYAPNSSSRLFFCVRDGVVLRVISH